MSSAPSDDHAPARLQALLDQLPAPFEPLDVSMLDGYLCGVLLQPKPIAPGQWMATVFDLQGRPLPPAVRSAALRDAVTARHAALDKAIAAREWFDPWIYELEEGAPLSDSLLPWVGGFALAMDKFPALMELGDPALLEPLALLYRHFDADDLEDADELLAQIEEIEPAADLAEAVEDVVRSVLLMADVSRPPGGRGKPVRRRPRQPR